MLNSHFELSQLDLLFDELDYVDQRYWTPTHVMLEAWIGAALAAILVSTDAQSTVEVSVAFVSSDDMQVLNRDYRGKDAATNVLSFPSGLPALSSDDDTPEHLVLGDIVICPEVVLKESEQQQKTPEHHWAHMVIHGLLHLHGMDHENDSDAQAMESMEVRILSQFDVVNPYLNE